MVTTAIKSDMDIESLPVRNYGTTTATQVYNNRVSWGAVFAGTIFGLMFQVWLSMLGVAIGASTVDPLRETNPLNGLGVGSGIWLGMTILVAAFSGGWVTGRLAGWRGRVESGVHGAISWAVSNFINFVVVGTIVGGIAAGANELSGRSVATAMNKVSSNVTGQTPNTMDAANVNDPAAMGTDQMRNAASGGETQPTQRQAGDKAAKAVSGTSFGIVFLMLLGLIAGICGSIVGAPRVVAPTRS